MKNSWQSQLFFKLNTKVNGGKVDKIGISNKNIIDIICDNNNFGNNHSADIKKI